MKILRIVADYNDGDYVTQETNWYNLTKETRDTIRKVSIEIAKRPKNHNWENGEYGVFNETLFDQYPNLAKSEIIEFDNFLPSWEYGIHTIEEIKILEVEEIEDLLK